ncbi:phage tail tape measure protein [Lachnospiraceae bacterium MD308]|nr:phage tail tape measure protein [Lachnospiraceae bacterium MD308]
MAMESVYKLSVLLNMVDQMSGPLSNSGQKTQDTVKKMNDAFGTMQKAGSVMAGAGVAITTAAVSTVTATFDTQNALGELSSLGVKDLGAVEKAAKRFSDQWAGTTKSDFITAAYDIKSGIASLSDEGVAKFTELSALTGKATKSTTEEMGSLFATGYGIYKGMYENLSDMEFGEVFSAGISTAVKNYKTSGSEMSSAISALGATATNANVSFEEQLAILGQLQTTMSGSEAATKYKSFLNQAASAGKKLGLEFTDTNNQLMSMPEILTALKSKFGDTIDAVEKQKLKEAFGTDEAVAAIDLLYNNVDTLEGGITDLHSSMQKGVSVTEEMAQAIQNTPEQKFERLKQQIHNNVEELGSSLIPAFNGTMDAISSVISKGSEWISNNQQLVSMIMKIVLGLGIFLAISGSVLIVVGILGKTFLAVKNAISIAGGAMGGLNSTFLASPVTWVIVGIVALVAAFIYLWSRSEAFRSFWIGLFDQVKGAVIEAKSQIMPALSEAGQSLMELYHTAQPFLQIIAEVGAAVLTVIVGTVIGAIQGVIAALNPILSIVSNIAAFVTNTIKAITALLNGDLTGALGFAGAASENLKNIFVGSFNAILSFAGGFASGFKGVIKGALSAAGVNVSGKMSGIKNAITSKLSSAASMAKNTMNTWRTGTVSTLSAMVNTYRSKGGGIKGAVSATMTGVSGFFRTGYATINSLTNGKLAAVVNTVKSKMNGAKDAVRNAVERMKSAFRVTFPRPKIPMPKINMSGKFSLNPPSTPKFSISWHKDGGILKNAALIGATGSTLHGAGEAGAEAILPLSVLWTKMKAIVSGIVQGKDRQDEKPDGSELVHALKKKVGGIRREPSLPRERDQGNTKTEGRRTYIQTLNIRVNMKDMKDLRMLERLIDELKAVQNQTDSGESDDEYVTV